MRYALAIMLLILGRPALSEPTPIELKVKCHGSGETSAFRITLLNGGPSDVSVVIGMSIGNGRRYVATSVVVEVRSGLDGAVKEYRASAPAIAGRVDPWIVPLPVGSEFSLTLPAAQLLSNKGQSPTLSARESFIRARVVRYSGHKFNPEMVGPGLVKVFDGELQTEWLRLPGACSVD
jgi:hypothetical protein